MTEGKLMRRRDFIKTGAMGAGLLASRQMLASSLGNANESPGHPDSQGSRSMSYPARLEDLLSKGFLTPPATAKPHTWWHWMDGNVTKEGITADLEAMQRVGLGGVHIFNVSYQIPQGPIKYMTPGWFEMMHHAAQEAERVGLEVGMMNCSGWSSSGGPWITPEYGMQKVFCTETRVKGPVSFNGMLAKADVPKYGEYYRDIAVLASKTSTSELATLHDANPRFSTSEAGVKAGAFNDIAGSLAIEMSPPSDAKPQFILFEFGKPFSARSFSINF